MRAGSLGDDVMGGGQTGFYQDLFDQQMAVHLSSGKGLGLADMLVRQLRGTAAPSTNSESAALDAPAPASGGYALNRAKHLATDAMTAAPETTASAATAADVAPGTPQAFVQAILPHAERAARELGVPARVLVAQAALETGWGKHAIKGADGRSSFNFFGIKADARWSGDATTTTTSEFVDGEEQRQRADFRAYDSAGDAFDDYVAFLKSNPRYAQALQHGGSARRFVQGLQNAGYATDPAYAQKILKIANGSTMQSALAGQPRSYTV
jgi:flagellar protein FlgJ